MSNDANINEITPLQETTDQLQKIVSKDPENISQAEIDKILNIQLPTQSIESIILVTRYTNEKLENAKQNMIKNIGLIKDQIDSLNCCVGSMKMNKQKKQQLRGQDGAPTGDESNNNES